MKRDEELLAQNFKNRTKPVPVSSKAMTEFLLRELIKREFKSEIKQIL